MKNTLLWMTLGLFLSCQPAVPSPSGRIEGGLRVLDLTNGTPSKLIAYRGDYILIRVAGAENYQVQIPDLEIMKSYPVPPGELSYIKLQKTGVFSFSAGGVNGQLRVLEYQSANYQSISAEESLRIISNLQPLLLDVRTPGEYTQSHIPGSILIPIQSLQAELDKLTPYRDRPVLIYCATGNRSTVAAQLLIEQGFGTIYNMRYGISSWITKGYPVDSPANK